MVLPRLLRTLTAKKAGTQSGDQPHPWPEDPELARRVADTRKRSLIPAARSSGTCYRTAVVIAAAATSRGPSRAPAVDSAARIQLRVASLMHAELTTVIRTPSGPSADPPSGCVGTARHRRASRGP
jgi:hypothetical protein